MSGRPAGPYSAGEVHLEGCSGGVVLSDGDHLQPVHVEAAKLGTVKRADSTSCQKTDADLSVLKQVFGGGDCDSGMVGFAETSNVLPARSDHIVVGISESLGRRG